MDFSIDSEAKFNEDQGKKGLHRENVQNGEIQDGRQRTYLRTICQSCGSNTHLVPNKLV